MNAPVARHPAPRTHASIDLHIKETTQLFDSLDPCPFYERDLDAAAEEYILASSRELRHAPAAIVIHIDEAACGPEESLGLERAIRGHFQRRTEISGQELRDLLRRGWISLAIGLTFLVALLGISEFLGERMVPGAISMVLQEGLVIGGWVAMWRPLEIFLYDWWPIAGLRRTFALLSRLPIQVNRGRAGRPGRPERPGAPGQATLAATR
jgi:hypothetical protein